MDLLLCGSFDSEERDAWLGELQRAMPDARWHLHAPTQNAERIVAAVVANPPPGSLQGLPGLRLIQSLWAGVDRLLDDPSLPEVPLARMVDPAMSAAMAETALWATLSLHRRFFDYAQQQRDRHWYPLPQRRAAAAGNGLPGDRLESARWHHRRHGAGARPGSAVAAAGTQ